MLCIGILVQKVSIQLDACVNFWVYALIIMQ